MDKLDLDLGDLNVDSFTTTPEDTSEEGTIRGYNTFGGTCYETCNDFTGDTCYCTNPDVDCGGGGGSNDTCYTEEGPAAECAGNE